MTTRDEVVITLADLDEAFERHERRESEKYDALMRQFMSAFPDGDPKGHHDYHNQKIVAAKNEADFWADARKTLVKAGVEGIGKVMVILMVLAAFGLIGIFGYNIPGWLAKLIKAIVA